MIATPAARIPSQEYAPLDWREFVAGVFEIADADRSQIEPRTEVVVRKTAKFALSEASTPSISMTRSPADDRIDGFVLLLVGADSVEGRAADRPFRAAVGDVLFLDLLESADLNWRRENADSTDLMVWVPRARMRTAFAGDYGMHGLVVDGSAACGAVMTASLRALFAQLHRAGDREVDAMIQGVLELIAKIAASTLEVSRRMSPQLASLGIIRRHIDKNLTAPELNVDGLAKTFGLSRASLYRLFEPLGGVAGYIRAAKLQRAYREISDAKFADRRIGPIAFGLGFKNVSAFNRLFRDTFGETPRALRAGAAPGAYHEGASPAPEAEHSLYRWLQRVASTSLP